MTKSMLALKSLAFLLSFSLVSFSSFSRSIKTSENGKTELNILSSSYDGMTMTNEVGNIKFSIVETESGKFAKIFIKNYVKSNEVGSPELPVRRKLIEVPYGATPLVKIVSFEVSEYSLADYGVSEQLFPLQPPQPKCGDAPEFAFNKEFYKKNEFSRNELVTVDVLGIMRNTRIARININPVEYNPVKNTIRVYENIRFEIIFEGADLSLSSLKKQQYYSPYFTNLFQGITNYSEPNCRENLTIYPVKYVIVSDRMFEGQLQDFIEWKTKKGFTVVAAYLDEIGDTKEEIKTYLQSLYEDGTTEDPAPSFVLFVGDIDQLPTWNNGDGVTDRNYCEYTGDLFPEVFYGRFSAENATQLQAYIDKTLQYEQYTMPDPSYLEEVVMIAGMDDTFGPTHGNGQINYGTINYFNADHDILSHTYLYPESGTQDAAIITDVSNGVAFANYTAHGWSGGWADPAFSISDIASLQNQDKYGLLIGNCCSTSEYQTTCFAEEIVRTAGKGALGYIGGSNSTYWDEDYYFAVGVGAISGDPPPYEETELGNYDRAFHDNGEEFGEWYTTMDQHIFAGNLAVSESGSSGEAYYWDIYNLMGDPSTMIYYGIPDEMTVSHSSAIMIGETLFSVDAVPFAYIGISMEGELHGAAIADETGHADVSIVPFTVAGTADIVVTAQNYQPYIETFSVAPAEGPFVVFSAYEVDDSEGNNNGKIDYHETIMFSISMENVGVEDAEGVEVQLACNDPYIFLIDSVESYETILAGEILTIANGFSFKVSDSIPDGHQVHFELYATEVGGGEFNSVFNSICYSYNLYSMYLMIIDNNGGNNNGKLEPGETASIVLELFNAGSSDVYNISAQLLSESEFLSVNSETIEVGDIEADNNTSVVFNVTASADAPEGIIANLLLEYIGDYGVADEDSFKLVIGQIPVLLLDLTSGSPSVDAFQSCLNVLNVGSEQLSIIPSPLDAYKSIFITLGMYPNNHVLNSFEANTFKNYLSSGGKIYMEGGDTWAYDEQTAFHSMFHINGLEDGADDLYLVTGVENTFTQGFEFTYEGANNYIDRLAPLDTAKAIFNNLSGNYDIAIAYEGFKYKTIGTSFEFGGLVDNETSTKDEFMANILDFFGINYIWTGINENETAGSQIQVYPNPASESLNIILRSENEQIIEMNLLDMLGRKVRSSSVKQQLKKGTNYMQLNVSNISHGIYYLTISTFDKNLTQKIIISN
ncbi:MAG TPA: C25 family cysteine peptidase [Bacteroidales bacterium]